MREEVPVSPVSIHSPGIVQEVDAHGMPAGYRSKHSFTAGRCLWCITARPRRPNGRRRGVDANPRGGYEAITRRMERPCLRVLVVPPFQIPQVLAPVDVRVEQVPGAPD